MELQFHELKSRQLSASYLALQESMELMSHIHRHCNTRSALKPLTTQPIDQRQLLLILVQITYLIFASQISSVSIRISTHIYIRPLSSQYYQPYALYILEQQMQMLNQQQRVIAEQFQIVAAKVSNSQFQNTLLRILDCIINAIDRYSEIFPQFFAQTYKKTYEQFINMLNNYIRPNLQLILTPRKFIECLEKTELFIDSSLLLKIKQNLFFENIRPIIEDDVFFSQLAGLEELLVDRRVSLVVYCTFLEKTLRLLVQKKLINFFGSIDEEKSKKKSSKNIEENDKAFIRQKPTNQPYQHKYNPNLRRQWQFYTKQSKLILKDINFLNFIRCQDSDAFEEQQKLQSQHQKNHFIFQLSPNNNLIIRLLFDLTISDNFQDNILLSLGAINLDINSPRLEIYRLQSALKVEGATRIEKRLCLSIVVPLSQKISLIGNILTGFDTLIVHQKIILAELNKPPLRNHPFHCSNLTQLQTKICKHLLIDNIHTFYMQIFSPQQSEDSNEKF